MKGAQPSCSFRAEPSKTLFSFLEEFFGGAQIRNRKEYFAWRRALASGGWRRASAGQEFLIKEVRAQAEIYSILRLKGGEWPFVALCEEGLFKDYQ